MNRGPEYQIAKDRVKISHFTEKGIDFKGVIHVGTNDGYEIEWYLMMGLKVLGFEPLRSAFEKCCDKYINGTHEGMILMANMGIGLESGAKTLHETTNPNGQDDSGGSSFLNEIQKQDHIVIRDVTCEMVTVTDYVEKLKPSFIKMDDYDCLVVDVQGMELDVLKSFDDAGILQNFKGLNIECSRQAWYEGEANAEEVIAWLAEHGFKQDSPIEDHNDIMFIRADLA